MYTLGPDFYQKTTHPLHLRHVAYCIVMDKFFCIVRIPHLDRCVECRGRQTLTCMCETSNQRDLYAVAVITLAHVGGEYSTLCVLQQNCCKLKLSRNVNKLQVPNSVI